MRFSTLLILAATFAVSSQAQDLSKEITVEKEIVPQHINVSRINITPEVSLSPVKSHTLAYSNRSINTPAKPLIATLEPARHAVDLFDGSQRGYVALGYFPTYNTALSAGYNFISTQDTRLNAWLQYDGRIYDGKAPSLDNEITLRDHTATLGASLSHNLSNISTLKASLDYTLSRFNTPVLHNDIVVPLWYDHRYQTVNNLNFTASINTTINRWDCEVSLDAGHFAYATNGYLPATAMEPEAYLNPARENRFGLDIAATTAINETASAGIELSVVALNYNSCSNLVPTADIYGYNLVDAENPDRAHIDLHPHYSARFGTLNTRIGARIGIAAGDGKSLSIAPDIKADWTPTQLFAAYLHIGGGEYLNTLSDLWLINRYIFPSIVNSRSSIPVNIEAGAVVGSWKGASAKLFAGYAVANDWLMPVFYNATSLFSPIDMKGWKLGGEVSYKYRDIAAVSLRYEVAPQKYDRGNFLWRDRAKSVFEAELRLSPIKPLDVTIGYELRSKRRLIDCRTIDMGAQQLPYTHYFSQSLGDLDRLSLSATYRYSSNLSFFASAENILDNRCLLISTMPDQGFTALLGACYKF